MNRAVLAALAALALIIALGAPAGPVQAQSTETATVSLSVTTANTRWGPGHIPADPYQPTPVGDISPRYPTIAGAQRWFTGVLLIGENLVFALGDGRPKGVTLDSVAVGDTSYVGCRASTHTVLGDGWICPAAAGAITAGQTYQVTLTVTQPRTIQPAGPPVSKRDLSSRAIPRSTGGSAATTETVTTTVTAAHKNTEHGFERNTLGSISPATFTLNSVSYTWEHLKYNTQFNQIYLGTNSAEVPRAITLSSVTVGSWSSSTCHHHGRYLSCNSTVDPFPTSGADYSVSVEFSVPSTSSTTAPTPEPENVQFPAVELDPHSLDIDLDEAAGSATLAFSWSAAPAQPVSSYEYRIDSDPTGRVDTDTGSDEVAATKRNLPYAGGGYNLSVRVRAVYTAPSDADLTVTWQGVDYTIAQGETAHGAWSTPESKWVAAPLSPVGEDFGAPAKYDGLLVTTENVLAWSGVAPERVTGRAKTLLTLGWLIGACVAAGIVIAATGATMTSYFVGGLVWLIIWTGLGPFLAGIPWPQAYLPAVLLIGAAGFFALKRGSI